MIGLVVLFGLVSCSDGPRQAAFSQPIQAPVSRPGASLAGGAIPQRFAVIGDYGADTLNEDRVSDLVKSWQPDFVITTGDNNYEIGAASTIDENIGQYYSEFIGNYQGNFGTGSPINRFWPSLGNHDWGTPGAEPYLDYFTLPGNERYYEQRIGLVHLFAIDSDPREPDGVTQDSAQAAWLQGALAASTACYRMVYFHHPPYSSGRHGSQGYMQWPFADWGADVVLSGHDHVYERLAATGIPFFVNGLGGKSIYNFDNLGNLPPGVVSEKRYNQDFGAMLVTLDEISVLYEFYNATGSLIDTHSQTMNCPHFPVFLPVIAGPGP